MSGFQQPGHRSAPPIPAPSGQADTTCAHCLTLGRVAGFMAHEIRNPLTTIALYGDILESDLQRLQSEQLRSQAETARAALFARRALLRQESNLHGQYRGSRR